MLLCKKYDVDYLFLFLISTGFVKGAFSGLKKGLKSLFCILLTFAIFALIFSPINNYLCEQGFLKMDFISFVQEKTKGIPFFNTVYSNKIELLNAVDKLAFPDFFKGMLKSFCEIDKIQTMSIGFIVGEGCYRLIVTFLLAIVLLTLIGLVVNIVLTFFLSNIRIDSGMFVTKHFLSGAFGVVKAVVIFVGIEIALLFIGEVLNIVFINDFIFSSNIGKIGFQELKGQVSIFMKDLF